MLNTVGMASEGITGHLAGHSESDSKMSEHTNRLGNLSEYLKQAAG
jgi:hypothetical protein